MRLCELPVFTEQLRESFWAHCLISSVSQDFKLFEIIGFLINLRVIEVT